MITLDFKGLTQKMLLEHISPKVIQFLQDKSKQNLCKKGSQEGKGMFKYLKENTYIRLAEKLILPY